MIHSTLHAGNQMNRKIMMDYPDVNAGIMQTMSVEDIIQMVSLPEFQRDADIDHVNSIYLPVKSIIERDEVPVILGCIVIAQVSEDNSHLLIDGNHRVTALAKFPKDVREGIGMWVNIHNCKTRADAEALFLKLNNTLRLAQFPSSVPVAQPRKVLRYFKNKYPKLMRNGKSGACNRPGLHEVQFQEHVGAVLKQGFTVDNVIERLEHFNNVLIGKNCSYFAKVAKQQGYTGIGTTQTRNCMNKAFFGGHKCYLGMVLTKRSYVMFYQCFDKGDPESIKSSAKTASKVRTSLTKPSIRPHVLMRPSMYQATPKHAHRTTNC